MSFWDFLNFDKVDEEKIANAVAAGKAPTIGSSEELEIYLKCKKNDEEFSKIFVQILNMIGCGGAIEIKRGRVRYSRFVGPKSHVFKVVSVVVAPSFRVHSIMHYEADIQAQHEGFRVPFSLVNAKIESSILPIISYNKFRVTALCISCICFMTVLSILNS